MTSLKDEIARIQAAKAAAATARNAAGSDVEAVAAFFTDVVQPVFDQFAEALRETGRTVEVKVHRQSASVQVHDGNELDLHFRLSNEHGTMINVVSDQGRTSLGCAKTNINVSARDYVKDDVMKRLLSEYDWQSKHAARGR